MSHQLKRIRNKQENRQEVTKKEVEIIKPQKGFQEKVLACEADIAIIGGGAGGGKSFAMLLDYLQNVEVNGYVGLFFRKSMVDIKMEGGIMHESKDLFRGLKAKLNSITPKWIFSDYGSSLQFAQMYTPDAYETYRGGQFAYIAFDELTHFTQQEFSFLVSRNRSSTGVQCKVRASCNPDSDSWLRKVIDWYIGEDGYIIPERDGVIRYCFQYGDEFLFANTPEELIEQNPEFLLEVDPEGKEDPKLFIKTFTFIKGSIDENEILLKNNPTYKANLTGTQRERLLLGNWNIKIKHDGLCNSTYINNIFNDLPDTKLQAKLIDPLIVCDYSKEGKDLLVVGVFNSWYQKETYIIKNNVGDKILVPLIRELKKRHRIGDNQRILFDQDASHLKGYFDGCLIFHGGGKVKYDYIVNENMEVLTSDKNYKNLKSQCEYGLSRRINEGDYKINSEQIYIYNDKTKTFNLTKHYTIGKIKYDVELEIPKQLRTVKVKGDAYSLIVRETISKDIQKKLLNGRSPDFKDVAAMRYFYDINSFRARRLRDVLYSEYAIKRRMENTKLASQNNGINLLRNNKY